MASLGGGACEVEIRILLKNTLLGVNPGDTRRGTGPTKSFQCKLYDILFVSVIMILHIESWIEVDLVGPHAWWRA